MKGIYKKISVGVLAAALLVGGSGILQGGQAFADSRVIFNSKDYIDLYDYLKEAKKSEEGQYLLGDAYGRSSDRMKLVWSAEDLGFSFKEVIGGKDFKADKIYKDGWAFRDGIKKGDLDELKAGKELKINIGMLSFIIKL